MTREELQSAIQDFWDEAFHYSKHEISDTSKAIALECMIDASNRENPQPSTNADRIRAMDDNDMAKLLCCTGWKMIEQKECLEWLQQPAEEE